MRAIAKSPEPPTLTLHRLQPYSDFDNYPGPDKDDLRDALVSEQRGLCCYCMGRIYSDRIQMKIEHWQCKKRYPTQQLIYRNLLAACLGGEGKPPRHQHCDTRKGNDDLKWNPADPARKIESRIRYQADGKIRSDDSGFDAELNQVLNLNHPMLMNIRKNVLDAVLEWWRREKEKVRGPVPNPRLVRKRNQWTSQTGELKPYCQVVVWWLNQA